jgi:hypothetical protein
LFEEEIDDEYKKGNLILDINKIEKVDFPVEGSTSVNIYNIKKNKKKILYPRFDVGVGLKNYGKLTGGGGIHIDNPQRIISIILFIGGYESISGGEHRIWEKKNNELDLFKSIKPEQNLLIASLQTNSAFHDVNPVKNIIGQRNTAYAAISCNSYVWKSIKRNTFNKKYNKNRYKKNITDKFFTFILTFIKKLKLKYL